MEVRGVIEMQLDVNIIVTVVICAKILTFFCNLVLLYTPLHAAVSLFGVESHAIKRRNILSTLVDW